MRKRSLLYLSLVLVSILAVMHFIAGAFYLYWTVGWYDYLMHFLAGVAGGLTVLWFLGPNARRAGLMALISVFIVGVAWEFFESGLDIAETPESYWLDTIHDMLMDLFGAGAAILLSRRLP